MLVFLEIDFCSDVEPVMLRIVFFSSRRNKYNVTFKSLIDNSHKYIYDYINDIFQQISFPYMIYLQFVDIRQIYIY